MDTTFWDLENSNVGWGKRWGKYHDFIITDLFTPTANIVVFDDVIGATESDHLPIICATNFPRLGSRNKGPMRFDASRVPRGCRLLRSPMALAECGGLMWCADPDTLAKHTEKPTMGDRGLLEPHELNDLFAGSPDASREQAKNTTVPPRRGAISPWTSCTCPWSGWFQRVAPLKCFLASVFFVVRSGRWSLEHS